MSDLLTDAHMRALLREQVEEKSSQKVVARQIGISPAYISQLLSGEKQVSKKVARYLGYETVTVYRKKRK